MTSGFYRFEFEHEMGRGLGVYFSGKIHNQFMLMMPDEREYKRFYYNGPIDGWWEVSKWIDQPPSGWDKTAKEK